MTIVQVTLENDYGERLTTWVDKRPDLHIGSKVQLKDFKPEVWWKVEAIYDYDHQHHASDFDWHRKWSNNI